MKEEILYRIVGVNSEVKRDMPDKFRSVLNNETYGTTYTEYDFKKRRYLFTFINDNFDIYDMLDAKDKEINRLNNIINELEKILEYEKNDYNGNIDIETHNIDSEFLRGNSWEADYILTKLQELKEGK